MKKIIRDNVELFAEDFGSQSDPAVLLIAGAMAPAVSWNDRFCRETASAGYHVIRFDNRDIGKSTHFPQSAPESGIELPYSIDDMVVDACAVLESYKVEKAHIVGHSLGGSIAQLFACRYPDKTLSLTPISSPILAKGDLEFMETDPEILEHMWSVLMSNPMYQDYERGAPEFLKVWEFLNGDWELDTDMANAYTKALYETEKIGPAWNHTNIQNGIRDILPELEKLQMPILFMHGEKDYLPGNPENTKILGNHLGNAETVIIEKGGHMFFNEQLWDRIKGDLLRHFVQGGRE